MPSAVQYDVGEDKKIKKIQLDVRPFSITSVVVQRKIKMIIIHAQDDNLLFYRILYARNVLYCIMYARLNTSGRVLPESGHY